MATINDLICSLDAEWEIPDGFFYKVRQGELDEEGCHRIESILRNIKLYFLHYQPKQIDRDIVRALWFIPTYLSWQDRRVKEHESGEAHLFYGRWCSKVEELMLDILGRP